MTNLLYLALAFGAGAFLGMFYFGSLWLTVRRITTVKRPEMLLLACFVMRAAACLAGFYFVMDGHWERLLFCLLGFILARKLAVRRWGGNVKMPAMNKAS